MHGLDPVAEETGGEGGHGQTMRFLFVDPGNPRSVFSSVLALRENILVSRDRVPIELWEEANRLYLSLLKDLDGRPLDGEPSELFASVRRCGQAMSGLVSEAMTRDEGHTFLIVVPCGNARRSPFDCCARCGLQMSGLKPRRFCE